MGALAKGIIFQKVQLDLCPSQKIFNDIEIIVGKLFV
jgi:hypothetical protein